MLLRTAAGTAREKWIKPKPGGEHRPGSSQFPGEYPRAEGTGRERSRATQQGPTCSLQSLQHIQGSRKSSGSAGEVMVPRRCFEAAEPAQGAGRGSAILPTHFPSPFPAPLAVPAAAPLSLGRAQLWLLTPSHSPCTAQGDQPQPRESPWSSPRLPTTLRGLSGRGAGPEELQWSLHPDPSVVAAAPASSACVSGAGTGLLLSPHRFGALLASALFPPRPLRMLSRPFPVPPGYLQSGSVSSCPLPPLRNDPGRVSGAAHTPLPPALLSLGQRGSCPPSCAPLAGQCPDNGNKRVPGAAGPHLGSQ